MFNIKELIASTGGITSSITTDKIVNEIENLALLFMNLRSSSSSAQASAAIMLYLKTHCSKSVLLSCIKYLNEEILTSDSFELRSDRANEILGDSFDMDDDDLTLDCQGGELAGILEVLRGLETHWSAVVKMPLFGKVSKLISMFASLGLCDLASFEYDYNGVRLFSIGATQKHVKASDLLSAIIDTVVYFVEGAYKCFTTKSLTPFLFSDDEAREADSMYFDVYELFNHAKSGNLEKHANLTENDYALKLDKAVDKYNALYMAASGSFEKKFLGDRLNSLRKMRVEFATIRVNGKLREAPYCVYIQGSSGVGKSSISAILMRIILMSNGFEASDDRLITINEADKFWSTYKSHMNGIFIDDLGNTKQDYVEKSPAAKIIDIVNNVPVALNMAELDLKGKVALEAKSLVITSNSDLSKIAHTYSSEPYSIVRRASRHYVVRVKKEFSLSDGRLDSAAVARHYGEIPVLPDIWDIDICEPSATPSKDAPNYTQYIKRNASLENVIDDLVAHSRLHFKNQEMLTTMNVDLDKKLKFCEICSVPACSCLCMDEQAGVFSNLSGRFARLCGLPGSSLVNYLPEGIFSHPVVQTWISFQMRDELLDFAASYRKTLFWFLVMLGGLAWSNPFTSTLLLFVMVYFYFLTVWRERQRLLAEMINERGTASLIFTRIRDNFATQLMAGSVAIATVYALVKVIRVINSLSKQGNLSPTSMADIDKRDSEQNPWANVNLAPVPVSEKSRTIVADDLKKIVSTNIVTMHIPKPNGKVGSCNAFFVNSNFALIPAHMFFADEFVATFHRGVYNHSPSFSSPISRILSRQIENSDLMLVQVTGAPSFKDCTDYIAQEYYTGGASHLVYRAKNGAKQTDSALLQAGTYVAGYNVYHGFNYELREDVTFDGMCMGVWISESQPRIVGFHLAGKAGKPRGAAGRIKLVEITSLMTDIRNQPATFVPHSAGTLPTTVYGKQVITSRDIHPKSPINYLEETPSCEIYGETPGRATFYSSVVTSVISQAVEDVCGVPQKWGKPKMKSWKPWRDTLVFSSKPSHGLPFNLVQHAFKDFIEPLLEQLETMPQLKKDIKPLENVAVVSGIDGKRFIDKMPPNTAVGFPLSGKKRDFLTALNPDDYPDNACPMELDPMFWEEFEKMKQCYLNGERAYPVFKASLKDEPTPLVKDKVRVFQCAPVALQLGIRKYFLPIARYLSLYPLLSECAVGVNAQGPEWEQLSAHMTKFGTDRILAGDYSKYDARMPVQLTQVAFRVLMDLADASGNYSEEDLKIMTGIATDVCFPLVAYNGDLIQFLGTNPSGQNLTVYINGIVNSVLLRCGFFSFYKNLSEAPSFRSVVSVSTYGDDVKGSVKEGFDFFNHISFARFLAENDMKFTMPDKTSDPVPYMSDEDADFLKRKNVYIPELDMRMGALDEDSIFKSLHANLHSKTLSKKELSMQTIDGALREWFPHGREIYEKRRAQMQEVADRCEIAYGIPGLAVSFDERVEGFREKYNLDQQGGEFDDLYVKAQKEIPLKCVAVDTPILFGDFGEVDMLFSYATCRKVKSVKDAFQTRCYIVVEIKHSVNKKLIQKGRSQVRNTIDGLRVLQPAFAYLGVLLTPNGYEVVQAVGMYRDILPEEKIDALPFKIP